MIRLGRDPSPAPDLPVLTGASTVLARAGEGPWPRYRIVGLAHLGAGELLTAFDGRETGQDVPDPTGLVQRRSLDGGLTWLAVLVVVNTVVSLAYYLRVVAAMHLRSGDGAATFDVAWNVSDPDRDLTGVNVTLVADPDGEARTVEQHRFDAGGARTTGSTTFAVPDGGGETYEVSIEVTDGAGNTVFELSREVADGRPDG